MTDQEIFSSTYIAFVYDNEPWGMDAGKCSYYGGCAIGRCIGSSELALLMDESGLDLDEMLSPLNGIPEVRELFANNNHVLLRQMQQCHDNSADADSRLYYAEMSLRIAIDFGLEIPENPYDH